MPLITTENAANAVAKLVANRALPALIGRLVIGGLVNRDYESVLANGGDVVNVPLPPTLVAINLSEGGTLTYQNPGLGNAQIALDSHLTAAFQITDVAAALANINLFDTYMQPAINAIAAGLEANLLANYPQFTANTPLGSATAMDEARLDAAETALFSAELPKNEPKFLIVSPSAYSAMRQIPRFTEYQTVGPAGAQGPMGGAAGSLPGATDGPFGADGRIKDFYVFRSQYVSVVGGTSYNIAFARDAMGFAIRRLPIAMPGMGVIQEYAELGNFFMRVTMTYLAQNLGVSFSVDVLAGGGMLRNQFGVIVKSL